MFPAEWNKALLGTSWKPAYKVVQDAVESMVWARDNQLTTNELVEWLYPARLAVGDGMLARNRIYKALKQLATRGLQDYCTKSTIPNKYGKFGWLWHAARPKVLHENTYSTLIGWLMPYLTLDDIALGRTEFLGTLSDRIIDDLEALERNGHAS